MKQKIPFTSHKLQRISRKVDNCYSAKIAKMWEIVVQDFLQYEQKSLSIVSFDIFLLFGLYSFHFYIFCWQKGFS